MTRDELIAWAKEHGWKPDRYGHLQKVENGNGLQRHYRLKLSRIAARFETKTQYGWVRLRSGYYKNLNISANGKLVGMTQ